MNTEQFYQMIETHEDWEVFIIDTVRKEGMNPWDIDVGILAEKCLKRVRMMKVFDFRVPAKVVLSAAILLRMKSDDIVLRSTDQIMQEYAAQFAEDLDEGVDRPAPVFPLLEPMVIRAPQSKVTIEDLLASLRKVLKEQERKSVRLEEMAARPLRLEIPEYNITEAIGRIMNKIKALVFGKPFVFFMNLLGKKTRREIAQTILPVLHLSNDGYIRLEQEQMFGPIKIYLTEKAAEKANV